MHLFGDPLFCSHGLFIPNTIVTTSAKSSPIPSPGTGSGLMSSCQPFRSSQGFGAPTVSLTLSHVSLSQGSLVCRVISPGMGEEAFGHACQRAQTPHPPRDLSTPICCRAGVTRRSATALASEGSGGGHRCSGWFNCSACSGTLP